MNKFFRLALLSMGLCAVSTAMAAAPDWGVADTVESHMVGPGMEYTKIIYQSQPLILWWTVIDLTNEYNKVEQSQSRNSVPDVLRWDVMTHYRENSREGHKVKVAWNHDFFSYDMGICIGMNISNGEMTWTSSGRSLLAITKDKKAEVFKQDCFESKATAPDGASVAIEYFNSPATVLYGNSVLFNRLNSLTLSGSGRYIKMHPQSEWVVNGADIPCKVLEISDSPLQTSSSEYVLYLRNERTTALDGHISVGDILTISQKFNGAKWGVPPADILNGFHGYPSLAHDGVLHDGEYNDFENGREYEKSSHVLAGISKDKTKLYVLVNEMSGQSNAVDCVDMTNWMLDRGAWDIVNFDSGGSAAIVIDEEMLNIPGRGSVRPVEDAMLAVSLAPEDDVVNHITFSKPAISPSVISLVPLRVLSYNQYDNVLDNELQGCQFICEPAELGYIDADAVFHSSSNGMIGKIYAEKDGHRAELVVSTRSANNVHLVHSDVVVSKKYNYLIEIQGDNNGEVFDLDPGAFTWESSDESVCYVEDGVVKGVKNGSAVMTGTFADIILTLNVAVEIPEKNILLVDNFTDINTLNPKCSGVTNLAVDAAVLPDGWGDGAEVKFDITSSRGPYARFAMYRTLYSLPDSISFQMYDKSALVKSVNVEYVDALGVSSTASYTPVDGSDAVYVTNFIENKTKVVAEYPIKLKLIQYNFKNAKIGTGYSLWLRNLAAYYSEGSTGVADVVFNENNELKLSVEGETLKAIFDIDSDDRAVVDMYSMTGRLIASEVVNAKTGCNVVALDCKSASTGIYIVSVKTSKGILSAKCIIR